MERKRAAARPASASASAAGAVVSNLTPEQKRELAAQREEQEASAELELRVDARSLAETEVEEAVTSEQAAVARADKAVTSIATQKNPNIRKRLEEVERNHRRAAAEATVAREQAEARLAEAGGKVEAAEERLAAAKVQRDLAAAAAAAAEEAAAAAAARAAEAAAARAAMGVAEAERKAQQEAEEAAAVAAAKGKVGRPGPVGVTGEHNTPTRQRLDAERNTTIAARARGHGDVAGGLVAAGQQLSYLEQATGSEVEASMVSQRTEDETLSALSERQQQRTHGAAQRTQGKWYSSYVSSAERHECMQRANNAADGTAALGTSSGYGGGKSPTESGMSLTTTRPLLTGGRILAGTASSKGKLTSTSPVLAPVSVTPNAFPRVRGGAGHQGTAASAGSPTRAAPMSKRGAKRSKSKAKGRKVRV